MESYYGEYNPNGATLYSPCYCIAPYDFDGGAVMTFVTKNFLDLPESCTPGSGKKDIRYKQHPVLVILSSVTAVYIVTSKKVAEVGMHFHHIRIGDRSNRIATVYNPPLKSDIVLAYLKDGQRNTFSRSSF